MLLNKEVEVSVVSNNLNKYLKLGYKIPQRQSVLDPSKIVYDIPTKIKISINDLTKYSRAVVDVLCDYCKKNICHPTYNNYMKVIETTGGTYACLDCVNKKRQENNKMKYGVAFTTQLQEVQEKTKKTNIEKRGYPCALVMPEVIKHKKQVMLDKYGVEHPLRSKEIREHIYQTNLERYGVKHPLQNDAIKQKAQQTNYERFGNIYASATDIIKERIKKSCQEKWGVNSYLATDECRQKIVNTVYAYGSSATSTQQKYICNLYNGILNYPCDRYNLDIVVDYFDIEIDFSGHDLQVKRGNITEKEFQRLQIIRDRCVKRNGYKIIRIISRKDYLPSDEILLSMLQYARDFFTQNPDRSWISFDIDNSCIYNAHYKESSSGLPYDYGKLRKIKKEHLSSRPSQTLLQPSAQ